MLKRLLGIAAAVALAAVLRRILSRRAPREVHQIPETLPVPPAPRRSALRSRRLRSPNASRPRRTRASPRLTPPHPQLRNRRPNLRASNAPRFLRRRQSPGMTYLLRLMTRRTLIRQIETQHADSPSPDEHSTSQAPDERNPPDSTRVNPPRPEVPNEAIPSTKQAVEPADQEAEDTQQRSRRDPRDRGGHPRGSDHSEVTGNPPQAPQPATPRPRAHLCVWMEGMEWQLGVEVGLATERALTVQQGDQELEQDEFDSERWLLTGNPGAIEVLDGDECVRHISDLEHELVPLVFRLTGDLERGVQITRPTAGAFLLLVPIAFPEPVLSSPDAAAVAESTSLSTFRAYFIDVENHAPLTVQMGSDYSILFNAARRRFSIVGSIIEDDAPNKGKRSSRQGKLYGQSPPEMVDLHDWDGVSTIIIGEEGGGPNRWRDEIDPKDEQEPSKQLRDHLAEKRAGWFFLRFYDNQGDLIESFDFRYAVSVIACRYSEWSATRRKPNEVLIEHQKGTIIRSVRPEIGIDLCEELPGGTRLRIPREKAYDHTEWLITDLSGSTVPLHLHIPRCWWHLGNQDVPKPTHFADKVIHLKSPDFRATSSRVLHLSVPKRAHRPDSLLVGFDRIRALQYPVRAEGEVQIPLREFSESAALSEAGIFVFKCWLSHSQGAQDIELELGSLELIARCSFCEDQLASSQTIQIEHCMSKHFGEIFEELSYQEIVRRNPNLNLPSQIYCCSHCQEYIRLQPTPDPSKYPTNAINRHLESKHPGKPHRFRVVSKSQEVRRRIISNLPRVYRCRLCRVELALDSQSESTILHQHLHKLHVRRIVQLA